MSGDILSAWEYSTRGWKLMAANTPLLGVGGYSIMIPRKVSQWLQTVHVYISRVGYSDLSDFRSCARAATHVVSICCLWFVSIVADVFEQVTRLGIPR